MKNVGLSLDQMKEWKRQIDTGSSLAIFQDPKTGKLYVAKAVTEYKSGFFTDLQDGNIMKSNTEAQVGISSIDKKKLGAGVNQLVYAVRVRAKSLAASTEAALIASAFDGNAPAYFTNGEVRISQNAELFRSSGSDVTNIKASTGNDDDFREVVPFSLRENTPFDVKFTLADVAVPNDAYKYEHRAIEFVEVAKA